MAEIIGSRLEERMTAVGLNQTQLAKRVGLKQPSIGRLISGFTRESGKLLELASAVRTTPQYLTGETDDPTLGGALADNRRDFRDQPAMSPEDLGLVAINEVDLALGAGGTYLDDGAVTELVRYFPAQWLREFTDAPPHMLKFARVRGTSMKPTIDHGAIVIIDLRRNRIDEQDEIWAIAVSEIGMVKRIWAKPDGSYKIKSDNPAVGPETAVDGEMFVIGRVVGGFSKF